jgi:hypothetical protein
MCGRSDQNFVYGFGAFGWLWKSGIKHPKLPGGIPFAARGAADGCRACFAASVEFNMSAAEKVAPSDLYITLELHRRTPKTTDHFREKIALQDIAAQMIDHPEQVLSKLVERAMETTGAVSAGISAFEAQEGTAGVFRWRDLKGELARFEGAAIAPAAYALIGSSPP